jgi:ADP-ribosylglycohydrolase
VYERRGPEVSAGNGSVIYCGPLGVVRAFEADRLPDEAPALSALTHWDERCRTACLAVTLAAAALVRGEDRERAVVASVEAVLGRPGGEELEHLVAVAGRGRAIDGPDQGFALFAAGVALRTAAEAPAAEAGLRQVVGLGGDTDTNAAVAGCLLGARDGRSALPRSWVASLADVDAIASEADAVAALVVARAEAAEGRRRSPALQGGGSGMGPDEIFELIVDADEKLKYATEANAGLRRSQARELLVRARDEARAIGNDGLAAQAETRLADLGTD